MKKSKVLAIFFFLSMAFLMPVKTDAQIIEVGATGGLSYYIGDINPKKHFSQNELGFGAVVRYYQNFRWAFRFQYSNINLTSSDEVAAYRPERKLSFNSNINDFALMAEFNFFDYWTGSNRNYITPYIFAGLSYFTCNDKDDYKYSDGSSVEDRLNNDKNKLEEDLTMMDLSDNERNEIIGEISNEQRSDLLRGRNISIPFGIGVKYSLFKRVGVSLEWRIHKTFTDKIDGVIDDYYVEDKTKEIQTETSKYSITYNKYKKEPFAYKRDWFSMLGLSITYRFNLPKKDACYSGAMNARY